MMATRLRSNLKIARDRVAIFHAMPCYALHIQDKGQL
jgi:hypothetical protein